MHCASLTTSLMVFQVRPSNLPALSQAARGPAFVHAAGISLVSRIRPRLRIAAKLPTLPPRTINQRQQRTDRSMRFIRMSERFICSDSVVVLATDFFAIDESAGLEIGDDPLHGPFGDSDSQRHLSQHQGGISRQEHQHVPMIRQKRPLGTSQFRQRCDRRRCASRTRF